MKAAFAELVLIISDIKSYNMLINPFNLGGTFVKTGRFHDSETVKKGPRGKGALAFEREWGLPGNSWIRDIAWPFALVKSKRVLGVVVDQ